MNKSTLPYQKGFNNMPLLYHKPELYDNTVNRGFIKDFELKAMQYKLQMDKELCLCFQDTTMDIGP